MSEVSEAARQKAYELAYEGQARFDTADTFMVSRVARAFARYIQDVSDAAEDALSLTAGSVRRSEVLTRFILPDPVDPLLIEARQIVANVDAGRTLNQTQAILDGRAGDKQVEVALAALKRGMELA